jgi:hypothetical protein
MAMVMTIALVSVVVIIMISNNNNVKRAGGEPIQDPGKLCER